MRIGIDAMGTHDFAAALTAFQQALQEEPNNGPAAFLAGNTAQGLQRYGEAAQNYQKAIDIDRDNWAARLQLLRMHVHLEQWADFQRESDALLKLHQDNSAPAFSSMPCYPIDDYTAGNFRVHAVMYPVLYGHFHVRYLMTVYRGKQQVEQIAAESDDVDQTWFRRDHPSGAQAGGRSFSLDSYSESQTPQGKQSIHGTIRFYPEGEPSYQRVREDCRLILTQNQGPMSTTTVTKP